MFGNLAAFVNGNIFMALFGPDIGVKLPGDLGSELLAVEGAGPYGPGERPMGGYVHSPPPGRTTPTRPPRGSPAPWSTPPRSRRRRPRGNAAASAARHRTHDQQWSERWVT